MGTLIPLNRPVLGEDLDVLREQLGLSTADACWLYGMSMTKWMLIAKKRGREPVRNSTLALLVRTLSAYPDANPLPESPTAMEIFKMIELHQPALDKKRLAITFGCEASSGYRWITVGSKISPVLTRLFMVFKRLYVPAMKRSSSAALSVLSEWERMVEAEALERGVPNIFAKGRWTGEDGELGRPIRGEDLDQLREQLGLSTADACWLFGMSMTKWMMVARKNGKEPVRNATLALLVRALRSHPEACPLPPMPSAHGVFKAISGQQPSLDRKRMAIMFGCEASSGYRWITIGSKISPVLARLFTVFLYRFEMATRRSHSAAKQILAEWDRMVETEAETRGVPNVYSVGRWTARAKAAAGPDGGAQEAKAAKRVRKPRVVAVKRAAKMPPVGRRASLARKAA